MKKLLIYLMLVVMCFSMVACKSPAKEEGSTQGQQEQQKENEGDGAAGNLSGQSVAKSLLDDFKGRMEAGEFTTTEDMAATLLMSEAIPVMCSYMQVEPGFLIGFPETEISGFVEGTQFGPNISNMPFIGYVFRAESKDAAVALADQLKEKADKRWNVCTEADEMVCEVYEDVVFFVMAPTSFDEE